MTSQPKHTARRRAPQRRKGTPTTPMPYALQLRVTGAQYRGLALIADRRGVGMAEVTREAIERLLRDHEGHLGGKRMNLLDALEHDADVGSVELAQLDDGVPPSR